MTLKPVTQISRSRHYLTLNVSETVRDTCLHTPYWRVSFQMTLSDLDWAKYLMTGSIARFLCDSWASCSTTTDVGRRRVYVTVNLETAVLLITDIDGCCSNYTWQPRGSPLHLLFPYIFCRICLWKLFTVRFRYICRSRKLCRLDAFVV